MRIAYVGLSTPLFYDYKQTAPRTPADLTSSPNPILDSPFGLFILFDEIWFLCRSLCPINMRQLPYVKFLDETPLLPPLETVVVPDISETLKGDAALSERYERFYNSHSIFMETVKRVGVRWDAATDNHTHTLQIGNIKTNGNSISLKNLLFDFEVVKLLKQPGVELITNSFSQRWLEDPSAPDPKLRLAEELVIDRIPNYLSPSGPYHPCVEEARGNRFLKDFRKWISGQPARIDPKELKETKREVENAIREEQKRVFLKHLDRKTEYMSVGKTLAGVAADVFLPGISAVAEIGAKIKEHNELKESRWQGFLVSLER